MVLGKDLAGVTGIAVSMLMAAVPLARTDGLWPGLSGCLSWHTLSGWEALCLHSAGAKGWPPISP